MIEKEFGFTSKFAKARKDMDELKAAQPSGYDVPQMKISRLDNVESQDLLNPFLVYIGQYIYKKVTFTADQQIDPFGKLNVNLTAPDTTTPALDGDISIVTYAFNPTVVGDNTLEWIVQFEATDNTKPGYTKFYADFIVSASDTGVVSISDP